MKTNLKNKPDLEELEYKIPGVYKKVTDWFNAFESELREQLKFELKQAKKANKDQQLIAHFQIDFINEIIGDDKETKREPISFLATKRIAKRVKIDFSGKRDKVSFISTKRTPKTVKVNFDNKE